jgi:hypothetical protein
MSFRNLIVTSPMMTGTDVRIAQAALIKNPFRNFEPGGVDGQWGNDSFAATRRAQYWLGRSTSATNGVYREALHLQLTGKRGLTTLQRLRRKRRLAKRPPETVGSLAFKVAAGEVGVKEDPAGSNDGPRIRTYQSATGAYRAPWCASFVSWCLDKTGRFKRDRGVNWAYCPSILAAARAGKANLSIVKTPRRGDLVLFDWQRDGTPDHIGFIDGPSSDGGWKTIEGNTSAGNNSNGGQVQRRTRYPSDITAFVRATRT